MKKLFVLAVAALYLTSSCTKSSGVTQCTNVEPSVEEPAILSYCGENGINFVKDTSGLYYEIIDQGAATKPSLNSVISITYTAKLLDDTVIDQQSAPVDNLLGALIFAWRIGMQKVGEGGRIKMVAPSALCYGCYGTNVNSTFQVPPNAILYFDVTLTDVK